MLGLAAVLTILGLAGWRLRPSAQKARGYREYTVEMRELGRTVSERGWLVSLDTVPVVAGATGDIVEITPTGTKVKEGQIVIRLDGADVREAMDNEAFGFHDAKQDLAASKAGYEYTKTQEENRRALLGKRLEEARLQEEKALEGLSATDRRLLEIELAIARLDLADAVDEHKRQQRLFEKGFVSKGMLEPFERRLDTSRASVKEIESRIRLEEKGAPPEELLELRKRVERIEGEIARAEKASERRLKEAAEEIRGSEMHVARHEHEMSLAREDLAGTEVRAPKSGILSVRLRYAGSSRWIEYKPGIKCYKYDRLADIVDLGRVKAEFMVHEADAHRIRVGMQTRVRLPAYPGRVFHGVVLELGGVGRDRADVAPMGYESGRSGVTVFNASVSLDAEGVDLRPGMSAIVDIIVAPARPQQVVTLAAVGAREGRYFVLRREANGIHEREVTGEPFDNEYFVVRDGLREGDRVVTPRALEESP